MRWAAVADFIRPLITFAPGPRRRWIALRAALALVLPLVGWTVAGHPQDAFLSGLGVFAVLYGASQPVRRRFATIPLAGAGLLAAVGLGVLTSGSPLLGILAMSAVATVAALLTYTLQIGAPAAFFFTLEVGIANLAVGHGTDPAKIFAIVAVGVLSAILIGTSDAWFGVHGIEEAAVANAEDLVDAYVHEDDPADLARARRTAARSLNAAWTAVTDGAAEEIFVGRLQRANNRYASAVAKAVGTVDTEVTAELALVETARVRQMSLGRPRSRWSLRQALRWPSEDLLVAARAGSATLLAGGLALSVDNAHAYWAAAFAVLIVQTGGTRRVQVHRAFQRTIGTGLGLLAFGIVLWVDPGHWPLVALVVALQFTVEMLVTKNYAVAVTFMTPLALTIATTVTAMDTTTVVLDRGLDTVIGVGVAVLVLGVSGRLGRPELLLRAHARRVVQALDDVLGDLVERRTRTEEGMAEHLHHCRQLYVELLASDQVAARTVTDAPDAVAPYREMEQLLASIGYLTLGATWNPRMRGERDRMAQARERLGAVLDHKVTRTRAAADITAELRRVEAALRAR